MPAWNPGLYPLIEAQVVERLAGRRGHVVERRERRRVEVLLDGAPDRIEVGVLLRRRVVAAGEEVGLSRVVRLGRQQVDLGDVEPLREALNGLVFGIDELATVLAGLAAQPRRRVRVHPSPDTRRCFVDRRSDAGVLERQGRVEAGDAAADDRDARGGY